MTSRHDVVASLCGVSRSYVADGETRHVLRDVTLSVTEGTVVTVTGPSGSGKSTMLNILGLLDRPSEGSVHIGAADATSADERTRAAMRAMTIGFVFQASHLLLHRSVLGNVSLGARYAGSSPSAVRGHALNLLGSLGLQGLEGRLCGELSGGERQRVAVARALVGHPRLLICDEPTGNLDAGNTALFLDLVLRTVNATQAVVIATHDPQVAAIGSTRVELVSGRVSGTGEAHVV